MLFLTIYFRDRPDAEKPFLDNVTHNFLPREGYPSGSQHCPGEGFFLWEDLDGLSARHILHGKRLKKSVPAIWMCGG